MPVWSNILLETIGYANYMPDALAMSSSRRKSTKSVSLLNLPASTTTMLRVKLPRFLVPRRKYEVNEDLWLVRTGRPMANLLLRVGRRAGIVALQGGYETLGLAARGGRVAASNLAVQGRKVVLLAQWRRMPKAWELSFVGKMKSMEASGIQFSEVLKTYLPSVLGEAPSEVLLNWVGRQTRHQPKRFVSTVRKMFGRSSMSIIMSLEKAADLEAMLEARRPVEAPYQSLVDAIRAADREQAAP